MFQKTHLEMIDYNRNDINTTNNYEYIDHGRDEYYEDNDDEIETQAPFVIVSPHPSFAIQNTFTILPSIQSSTRPTIESSESDSNEDEDEDEDELPPESILVSDSDEVIIEGVYDDLDDESTY
jgi:hypothetical protein